MLGSNFSTTRVRYLCFFYFNSELKKIFSYSKKIYKSPQLGMAVHPDRFNFMSYLSFTCPPNVAIELYEATVYTYS